MYKTFADLKAKRANGDNGFTLIELLVVVVILGVLIAIAIPVYLNYRRGANDSATQSDMRNAVSVLEVCNAGNKYPTDAASWVQSATVSSVAPCTGQKLSLSSGTNIKYVANAAGAAGSTGSAAGTCYAIFGYNTAGTPKYFTYSSAVGGSVTDSSTQAAYTAAAAPTC